jgi:hypothetical protein
MIPTKSPILVIVSLKQTCSACPSQWDAQTSDGRYVYIRYRWGMLRVDIAASREAWVDERTTLCYVPHGDSMAGSLSTEDMKRLLLPLLDFRERCDA